MVSNNIPFHPMHRLFLLFLGLAWFATFSARGEFRPADKRPEKAAREPLVRIRLSPDGFTWISRGWAAAAKRAGS